MAKPVTRVPHGVELELEPVEPMTKYSFGYYNSKNPGYKNYGARGISVCFRWHEASAFMEDMGQPPPGMTLERKDVNGNYEPSNCEWANRTIQSRNRRRVVTVEYAGETLALSELCERLGRNKKTAYWRWKQGWDLARVLG